MRPVFASTCAALLFLAADAAAQKSVTSSQGGRTVATSWRDDAPGKRWHISADALARPFATGSASNGVRVIAKPPNAQLKVPPGFEVKLFASGLTNPRQMRVAPNGDIFV